MNVQLYKLINGQRLSVRAQKQEPVFLLTAYCSAFLIDLVIGIPGIEYTTGKPVLNKSMRA